MSITNNWLDKPAIQWNTLSEHSADTADGQPSSGDTDLYWDKEGILPSTTKHGIDKGEDQIPSTHISYRDLFHLSTAIVERLRALIPAESSCGIPVAVAIPEGPFLPLAILAVHLLNNRRINNSYVILVPMESGEGKERLVHMIGDARPALVLTVADTSADWSKMEEVIAQADCGDQDNIIVAVQGIKEHRMLQSSQPQLVDFAKLIRQVRDETSFSQQLLDSPDLSFWNLFDVQESSLDEQQENRISHICYTSGTTGVPKGCISSRAALRHYLSVKNEAHGIEESDDAVVLLCSALSFDPCLSDILATLQAKATLVVAPRKRLLQQLAAIIRQNHVTHVLCTPTLWSMVDGNELPSLQVVALGGEPIPKRIVHAWANKQLRLCATYGVTEACVYQTMGQVTGKERVSSKGGQCVGKAFRELSVQIIKENDPLLIALEQGETGEVVLAGTQLDGCSGYLNRGELTASRFVSIEGSQYYKTGDKGYIDENGNLFILGRIQGQDGMVKINGVRIELGEIEVALIDDIPDQHDEPSVVDTCLAVARFSDPTNSDSAKQIHAFCILSQHCSKELGIEWADGVDGIIVSGGPLLVLLRMRCLARVRAGSMPSVFVLINQIPLSATGKSDRRNLPQLADCITFDAMNDRSDSVLLKEHGKAGAMVSDVIIDMLNLQVCQQSMLTTSSNFAMLGGDSLAATRVVRTLYANHEGVHNSRFLGGSFGTLDGAFSVSNLLLASTLGEYVDWLDTNSVCGGSASEPQDAALLAQTNENATHEDVKNIEFQQYDALLEATTIGHTAISVGLLNAGVDPNIGGHDGRLSKVSSRLERKKTFKSNPLHVACNKGNPAIVRKLLAKGCKFNSPDASGNFPLHMAASGSTEATSVLDVEQEDLNRAQCVKMLLDAGAPMAMKDSNKQVVLHSAARAGHCHTLRYLLGEWEAAIESGTIKLKASGSKNMFGKFMWMDRWYRTPVHWAVLNGKVGALEVLLQTGYSASPPSPSHKSKKRTSVQVETPLEICDRLYNEVDPKWRRIRQLLVDALRDGAVTT